MTPFTPDIKKQVLEAAAAETLELAKAAQKVASESNFNNPSDPAYIAAVMATITQLYLKGLNPRA